MIVRLDQDKGEPEASAFDYERLTDKWYYMLGPLLPTRAPHAERADPRQEDGSYEPNLR